MLRGRFGDTTGRPFLEGQVNLTRMGLVFEVSFLVDTGADRSLITPMEGMRMGINYSDLTPGGIFEGLGGIVEVYEETAILEFVEGGEKLHAYTFAIGITPPRKRNRPRHPEDVSALLGRDVLSRWRMSYNPSKNRITFDVISSDFTRKVPKGSERFRTRK